jgi:hypothetical protein
VNFSCHKYGHQHRLNVIAGAWTMSMDQSLRKQYIKGSFRMKQNISTSMQFLTR